MHFKPCSNLELRNYVTGLIRRINMQVRAGVGMRASDSRDAGIDSQADGEDLSQ